VGCTGSLRSGVVAGSAVRSAGSQAASEKDSVPAQMIRKNFLNKDMSHLQKGLFFLGAWQKLLLTIVP
jgi:hypothetical protein